MESNQTYNVTIIGGAGKMGLNLAKGITRFVKKYKDKKVVVTVLRIRDDVAEGEKLSQILKQPDVLFSSDYQSLEHADMVFIGIPPVRDAINAFFTKVGSYLQKNIPIISYSSGLSLGTMKQAFRSSKCKKDHGLLRITLNTNVDTGNGIVYYAAHQQDSVAEDAIQFLSPIAQINKVASGKMSRFISSVGSVNAYDGLFIKTLLMEYPQLAPASFVSVLESLVEEASMWNGSSTTSVTTKWLDQKVLGYKASKIWTRETGVTLSKATFISTLKSFIFDIHEYLSVHKNATKDDLLNLLEVRILAVPTPDGCTEKQLSRQRKAESTQQMITIIASMIEETYAVAKKMSIRLPLSFCKLISNFLTQQRAQEALLAITAKK